MAAGPRHPRAPKKSPAEHVAIQRQFLDADLRPALDAADATRAASGRQRFNVLGAWDAVTRRLLSVTDTTVVNTDTMCQLLRAIAAERWGGW